MRLIHTSRLELCSFMDDSHLPEYAILSHTWGSDEVTLQQFTDPSLRDDHYLKNSHGYQKIIKACRKALEHGYEYIWVDTCCTIQTHHRRQRPTKRVAYAAENGGRTYIAFQYTPINISVPFT